MVDLTRRKLMASSVAAALGASVGASGVASADVSETNTPGAPSVEGELKRFATTSLGAEVTGPFVFEDGTLLFSHQHPSTDNPGVYGKAGIGYVKGFNFTFDGSNDDFSEVSTPQTEDERGRVRVGEGEYTFLATQEDAINGGSEQLGVPTTPDGTDIDKFAGSRYSEAGHTPDCNQFVPTNEEGTEGYLFTNFEASPGNVTRIPISKEGGEWNADLENAINLSNTQPYRDIGGTRINCYGDRSPWGTMISSEEEYGHTRVSYTATVGDIVEKGTGEGLRGGREFWNRPDPTGIQNAVDNEYSDVEGWSLQGYWALAGLELLAYYLGADPVDQRDFDASTDNSIGGSEAAGSNTLEPIGDVYPNPYRYGYHVDIREPEADTPQPIKYYVMGRAAWESPDIQSDRKTVYGCSDGDSKGIYKFVADRPIDSYDDPMDIAGTIYAPKITNDAANAAEAGQRNSPATTPLEVEWIELGHATNREVASWIAEYDDVTQVDYLETHADTDWQEDLDAAIEEADKEVIENGNQNYITDEEIVKWAEQFEKRGPDGVDEDLRKVPFLELRAAAKEIGASLEFNKAEGVDSIEGAQPGDFVYFGISEFNDDLANETGDVRMARVDGGVVYRAELERNFNVSRLEPVVTGPDSTDSAAVSDDAVVNVDNVYVMDDGRVLCCEDADQLGRSYPNDCMYVYQPNVVVDAGALAVRSGATGTVELTASSLPTGFSGGEITVELANSSVGTITGVEFPDELGLTKRSVSDDGSSATIRVADVEEKVQGGGHDVTLATLTVRGDGFGTTDLEVTVHGFDDENGSALQTEARAGLLVTGPTAVTGSNAPKDHDGDGLYEDVNGNGRMDYEDVNALFESFDSESVRLNKGAYDFNENGELDYDDIVDLYRGVN
ncbi:alkaline phosphatase PhoX [Halarchaeum sp. P4]|uniref:alkaline phosphatase PhoX n=1 Tax=Halarchaeum sp. P4 TaxID=3421639 RepID=UPI003EB99E4B